MDGKEEVSPVFDMPETLKSRLSTLWTKCINMLYHSSLPSTSAQTILDDALLRQDSASSHRAESWEEILLILTEEDAVVRSGYLKLQPVFFSLPKIVQTKFLYLVLHNAPKICSHHLRTFAERLESAEAAGDSWVQNLMTDLRRYLKNEESEKDTTGKMSPADYEFSSASQDKIVDLLQKLKDENTNSFGETSLTLNTSNQLKPDNQNVELQTCQKVVDVIIIDDDDDESQDISDTLQKDKLTDEPVQAHPASEYLKTSYGASTEGKDTKIISGLKRSLSKADGTNEDFSEACTLEVTDLNRAADRNIVSKRASSPEMTAGSTLKVPKLDEPAVGKLTSLQDSDRTDQPNVLLTDSTKAHLEKLKELFFGDKSPGNVSNKITFLLDLSSSQLEAACDYLKLSEQTEESLIGLCDCVPWAELEYSAASALLTGCLFHKVATSQSHVSQTLLTVIVSVLRGQPRAVLDLLVKAVCSTHSDDFQCQLLATLCKDSLSHEWLCYLIKRLSEEPAVIVNDNLLSVLQAVIDRRAELDPESLTSLLILQVRGCQALASSSRFGKCLMACLTKYGKKMTAENRARFSSLVDTHGSNFKPALNAAFKRLNR